MRTTVIKLINNRYINKIRNKVLQEIIMKDIVDICQHKVVILFKLLII